MPTCHHRVLAERGFCVVDACDRCGLLRIHLGPMSVRFDRAAAEDIWRTLGEALAVHEEPAPRRMRGSA